MRRRRAGFAHERRRLLRAAPCLLELQQQAFFGLLQRQRIQLVCLCPQPCFHLRRHFLVGTLQHTFQRRARAIILFAASATFVVALARDQFAPRYTVIPVSYTHLTLPTIYSV